MSDVVQQVLACVGYVLVGLLWSRWYVIHARRWRVGDKFDRAMLAAISAGFWPVGIPITLPLVLGVYLSRRWNVWQRFYEDPQDRKRRRAMR
jgi:hypothetical protein